MIVGGHHISEPSAAEYTLGPPEPATGLPLTSHPGPERSRQATLHTSEAADATGQEPDENADLRRKLDATQALLQRQIDKTQQLHQAVNSRDMIGQAKGILMERHKISAERAFAILQDESSRTNRKLAQVAEQFIYSGAEADRT